MTNNELSRFLAKIEVVDTGYITPCWLWNGRLEDGYGRMRTDSQQGRARSGRMERIHRLSYAHWVAPIPDKLQPDHLCRNRGCGNPDHLEVVTQRVNIMRGEGIAAKNAQKDRCVNGHLFTPENTSWNRTESGHLNRRCKRCHSIRCRNYLQKVKERNEAARIQPTIGK